MLASVYLLFDVCGVDDKSFFTTMSIAGGIKKTTNGGNCKRGEKARIVVGINFEDSARSLSNLYSSTIISIAPLGHIKAQTPHPLQIL